MGKRKWLGRAIKYGPIVYAAYKRYKNKKNQKEAGKTRINS